MYLKFISPYPFPYLSSYYIIQIRICFFTLRKNPTFSYIKTRLVNIDFHTLVRNILFLFPINVGSHNLPRGVSVLTDSHTICNSSSSLPADTVFFELSFHGFKMLRRVFHILIKKYFVPLFNPSGSRRIDIKLLSLFIHQWNI